MNETICTSSRLVHSSYLFEWLVVICFGTVPVVQYRTAATSQRIVLSCIDRGVAVVVAVEDAFNLYAICADGYDPSLLMDANSDYMADRGMFDGSNGDYVSAAYAAGAR